MPRVKFKGASKHPFMLLDADMDYLRESHPQLPLSVVLRTIISNYVKAHKAKGESRGNLTTGSGTHYNIRTLQQEAEQLVGERLAEDG